VLFAVVPIDQYLKLINKQKQIIERSIMRALNITIVRLKATQLRKAKNLASLTMKWRPYAKRNGLKDKAQFVAEVLGKTTDRKLSKRKKIKVK